MIEDAHPSHKTQARMHFGKFACGHACTRHRKLVGLLTRGLACKLARMPVDPRMHKRVCSQNKNKKQHPVGTSAYRHALTRRRKLARTHARCRELKTARTPRITCTCACTCTFREETQKTSVHARYNVDTNIIGRTFATGRTCKWGCPWARPGQWRRMPLHLCEYAWAGPFVCMHVRPHHCAHDLAVLEVAHAWRGVDKKVVLLCGVSSPRS